MKTVKRGYFPEDTINFSPQALLTLRQACRDVSYLINNGYPLKSASEFVGNHYLLSERQRLCIVRSVSPEKQLVIRRQKQQQQLTENSVVYIDGFNIVITLEVALSKSPIFRCMDTTVRDLAGLRGTYRIIDKTEPSLHMIASALEQHHIRKSVVYFDAPVSNSGRLAQKTRACFSAYSFATEIIVTHDVDRILEQRESVISSDAIILDKCISWYNLTAELLRQYHLSEDVLCICDEI